MGDELSGNTIIRIPYTQDVPKESTDKQLIFKNYLLKCDETAAPVYPSSTTKCHCVLTADLRSADRSKFEKAICSDGRVYWKIKYQIVIYFVAPDNEASDFLFALDIYDETEFIEPRYT
jgi:hypothetical protein